MNPHRVIKALFVLSLNSTGASATPDTSVGVSSLKVNVPERIQELTVTLWYPAGESVKIGENAVFEGVSARRDASIAEETFPVVLISHGGLRAAPNLASWIGADLAAKGFVAAVVESPLLVLMTRVSQLLKYGRDPRI